MYMFYVLLFCSFFLAHKALQRKPKIEQHRPDKKSLKRTKYRIVNTTNGYTRS